MRKSGLAALLTGLLLVVGAGVGPVAAYTGQVPANVTVTYPVGTLKCGVWIEVRATIVDASAHPVDGATVTWVLTGTRSSADVVDPTTSVTDSNGVAKTRVKFGCVAGTRQLTGAVDGIVGQPNTDDVVGTASMRVTADGLPGTDALPAAGVTAFTPLLSLTLGGLGLLLLAIGIRMLRRRQV